MEKLSNIFFTEDFSSFSEFVRNAKHWKLDFRKLDKGPFKARLSILDMGTVQFIRTQLSGVIDQIGQIKNGYRTFVIPANSLINAYWLNTKVEKDCLIVFPKSGRFSAVSHGEFDVFAISINELHLQQIAQQCNATNLQTNLKDEERVFEMDTESYKIGQELLHEVFTQLKTNPEIINNSDFVFHVKYKIPYLITHFLNNTKLKQIKPFKRSRDKALNTCIQYISDNVHSTIPVSRLSEIAQLSERTIEYAFMERYGIAPKTYITYIKLNKIKDVLSNPENTELISAIAQKFGFKHMGQFSADYKSLIGELPRQTCRKTKA